MKLLEKLWLSAAVIAALIGIIKYFVGYEVRIGPPFGPQIIHPNSAPDGNYSTFGKFLVFTIVYFVFAKLKGSRLRERPILLISLMVMGFGLILTMSRACWLALIIVFVILFIKERFKLVSTLIVLAIAVIFIIPSTRERLEQSLSPEKWSSGRMELWEVAFERVDDSFLFGHGLGSFDTIITHEIRQTLPDPGVGDWHNQFLQIYMESGFVGLMLFGWLLFELFRACFFLSLYREIEIPDRHEDSSSSTNKDTIVSIDNSTQARIVQAGIGGLALLSCFMIISMFDNTLNSPILNITFWCMIGLTVGWLRTLSGRFVK